jgi:16S rRNA (cytidine1402-2'-O)-methyltransferase
LVEQLLRLLPSDEGRAGWGVEKENTSPSQSPPELRGRRNSVTIIPIPGPNAAIAALSVSGFPTDKFIFMGFPPHKKGREKFFREVAEAKYTVVFYESSHRILKALEQLKNYAPDKNLVVCRELTKMFESIYRGSAEEIIKILESDKNNLKGEFVVIVNK